MKLFLKIILIILGIIVFLGVLFYAILFFYPEIGHVPNKKMREEYESRTNYFYQNQFHNLEEFSKISGSYQKNEDAKVVPTKNVPVITWNHYPEASNHEFSVNFLGHSSSVIQMNGNNILIDPVLTEYASPVNFAGPKRFSSVAILPENIPNIQFLLISHDHYDHLDYETIQQIDSKVEHYLVPLGVESYLEGWGIDKAKISTFGWWDEVTMNGITFTATPAQHYSGRNPIRANATWWCGYYFTDGEHSLYFTGDSGYGSHFSDVYQKFGEIDVFLADSGQYNTAWSKIHMNPLESLQAAKDVHAKYFIPVHWGTFVLSNHDWNAPAKISTEHAKEFGITVVTPKIGERLLYDQLSNYQSSWWDFD